MTTTNYLLKKKTRYIRPNNNKIVQKNLGYFFNTSNKNSNEYKAFFTFYNFKHNTKVDLSLECLILPNPRNDFSYCSFREYLVYSPLGKLLFSWNAWLNYFKK